MSLLALLVTVAAFASVPRKPPSHIIPDAPSYIQLAESLATGNGYRIDRTELPSEPAASRYPPGLPLVLAPMSWFVDVSVASVVLAVGLVGAVWWTARRMAGDVAATVAVLSLALTAPLRSLAGYVMADIPAALLSVLALLAWHERRPRLAGALAVFSVWVRLAQIVLITAVSRRAYPVFGVGVVLLVATKAWWGWGYRADEASWALGHIVSVDRLTGTGHPQTPNVLYYLTLLLGLRGGLMLPGALVAASVAAWKRPERRFFFPAVLGTLAIYIPYFYQDDRFMYPVVALIAIFAGCWCADLVDPAAQSDAGADLESRRRRGRPASWGRA